METKVIILMARHEMRAWVLVWTGPLETDSLAQDVY